MIPPKICKDCDEDITGTHSRTIRCKACQNLRRLNIMSEYQKRIKANDPEKYKAYHRAAYKKWYNANLEKARSDRREYARKKILEILAKETDPN